MIISLKEKAFNFSNRFVVAMDGPSASGKGRIGQMLAKRLKLVYYQSSIVYRTLAQMCINRAIDQEDKLKIIELAKSPQLLEYASNFDLNDENIAAVASKLATIKEVRQSLTQHLQQLIAITPRILMEGRDIGTVVAPEADLKIFMIADVNTRAKRRYKQLLAAGKSCILNEILEQLKARDLRDQERAVAPLIPAEDALIIDNSNLLPGQVRNKILEFINTNESEK